MVELKGSEKQVKWANDLREGVMQGFNEFEKRFVSKCEEKLGVTKGLEEEHIKEGKEVLEAIRNFLENEEKATFFIDNFRGFDKLRACLVSGTGIKEQIGSSEFAFRGRLDFLIDTIKADTPKVITWYRRNISTAAILGQKW